MTEQLGINFNLTHEEQAVWNIIRYRRGKPDAVLGTVIAEITGIYYDRVRAIIADLINKHYLMIASNSKGYYVPVTPDEISEATRSLRHRAIMILVRASRLQKISLEEIFHQARMEFGEAIQQ